MNKYFFGTNTDSMKKKVIATAINTISIKISIGSKTATAKQNSLKLRLETDTKTTIHAQISTNIKAITRIGMIGIMLITTVSHSHTNNKINDFG